MRVRFAPSPTGHLHVGNARTALFNWLLARRNGGTLILRVEDTDQKRSTKESETSMMQDLRWLGLDWDEGPDVGGQTGPYRQSERLDLYAAHASRLLDSGHAYYCFCAASEVEADGHDAAHGGRAPCPCGRLSPADARARIAAGERPAIRFRVPAGRDVIFSDVVRGDVRFHTDVIADPIIVRATGIPAYNFAVVVDDALMEVTHVVRGEDHISNTPRQILMYEALGFRPPVFAHLALVLGPDHSPLSKRHGATSVAEFRSKGYLPEALVNYLALLGWSPREHGAGGDDAELVPIEVMAERFALEDVGVHAGVFDEEKLAWANRHYLRVADPRRIAELAIPYFVSAGLSMAPDARGLTFLSSAMPIATASIDRVDQIPARLAVLFQYDGAAALADKTIRAEMTAEPARAVVRALAEVLADAPRLVDRDRFRAAANDVKTRTGQKGKALFHPIRIALTARAQGPELDLAVPAIDTGADLPRDAGLPPILGCRERARAFVDALERLR